MSNEIVEFSVIDRIGTITLNRPEKRNAFSPELVEALQKTVDLAARDSSVKVIVLKAKGEAFCAGADLAYLKQLQSFSFEDNLADSTRLKELLLSMYTHPKVIVAMVEGPALAGGCGLATVCDFIWATPEAKFGYTEVKIGFIPAIVAIFLIRKIGEAKARELLLTGKLITASEAQALGLVANISEKKSIESDVDAFVRKLANEGSGQSLASTKKLIWQVQDLGLLGALDHAAKENAMARGTEDCRKGIEAFLNKRELKW